MEGPSEQFKQNAAHLLEIMPPLVWNQIAPKHPPGLPELGSAISSGNCVQSLFPTVFKVLYEKAYLDGADAKICRSVCSKWTHGVDNFFQTNNFESMENISGAKNSSALVLKMPLRLIDFDRLHQLNLHPRCVSYGKKLSLKLDQGGLVHYAAHVFHRIQLLDLVKKVITPWQYFEHLEIGYGDGESYWSPVPEAYDERGHLPYINVPYGDLGVPEAIDKIKTWVNAEPHPQEWYDYFRPEDFQMLIPFLQHLTNLRTVSFFIRDRRQIANILLRIPNTAQLEKIFIGGELLAMNLTWNKFLPLMYTNCSANLSFLSGCTAQALDTFYDLSTDAEIIFQNLIELQVTIETQEDTYAIQSLTAKMQKGSSRLCPKLLILQVRLEKGVNWDAIDNLYPFAALFPTIRQFGLAGHCLRARCAWKRQIRNGQLDYKAKSEDDINTNSSSVTTFQIDCSHHVPIFLMRHFPNLNKVVVADSSCRRLRRTSRANDWKYVRGFFALFRSNLRMVTFVPSIYGERDQFLSFEPGAITCYRNDSDKFQQRKRKRALQDE